MILRLYPESSGEEKHTDNTQQASFPFKLPDPFILDLFFLLFWPLWILFSDVAFMGVFVEILIVNRMCFVWSLKVP